MAQSFGQRGLVALFFCACTPDPEPDRTISIRAHSLPECPVAAGATIRLEALGDFDASSRTSEPLPVSARGQELGFPASVQAIAARASDASTSFVGLGQRGTHDEIHLLLYPEAESCVWFRPDELETYPSELAGVSLGISRTHQLMLVVGGEAQPSGALTVDLGTGEVLPVTAGEPRRARADASVTEFDGGRLLVAGGSDTSGSVRSFRRDAQVFDPISRRFEASFDLEYRRSRHGAISLEGGRVLLIGGEGYVDEQVGAPILHASLEAVTPATRSRPQLLLERLDRPRRDPVVLRLSDGRIFVGGGSDDAGPVELVEWFTADGARRARRSLAMSFPARAFAALPGGGVLAVGDGGAAWITPEGTEEPIPIPLSLPIVDSSEARYPTKDPVLISASDGAPLLVGGPAAARELNRFAPWTASFEPVTSFGMPLLPGPGLPSAISLDPGAFAFFALESAEQPVLIGLRHDTRDEFARDAGLVEEIDPRDARRPLHLVPDRPPGAAVSYADGVLELRSGGVVVPDTSYQDLQLEISVRSGPLPIVMLGGREFGATDCPWPGPASVVGPGELVRVLRHGEGVVLERSGQMRECRGEPGRVSLGLRFGGGEPTVIESITPGRELQLDELRLE